MTILTCILIWVIVGNLWVDLLNGVSKKFDMEIPLKTRLLNILVWPLSIHSFMTDIKNGSEPTSTGDTSAEPDMRMAMKMMDAYVASKLGTDIDTYNDVMNNMCTDEERDMIIEYIVGEGDEEAIQKAITMFSEKISYDKNRG